MSRAERKPLHLADAHLPYQDAAYQDLQNTLDGFLETPLRVKKQVTIPSDLPPKLKNPLLHGKEFELPGAVAELLHGNPCQLQHRQE